jgi:hypothetical protein
MATSFNQTLENSSNKRLTDGGEFQSAGHQPATSPLATALARRRRRGEAGADEVAAFLRSSKKKVNQLLDKGCATREAQASI